MTEAEAVEKFRGFVIKTARAYAEAGVNVDDLIQEGLLEVVVVFRERKKGRRRGVMTHYRIKSAMRRFVLLHAQGGVGRKAPHKRGEKAPRAAFVSMDATAAERGVDGAGEDGGTLHDVLGLFEEPPDFLALRRLPGAIATLPKIERNVIRMRFVDGLRLVDVGKQLGCSIEWARKLEAEALKKLRAAYQEKSFS